MLGDKHIRNAEMASEVWLNLEPSQRDSLRKYFHLRPTSSGVTIIYTLPIAPMRGVGTRTRDELRESLHRLYVEFPKFTSTDDEKSREVLKKLDFKARKCDHPELLEEYTQATLINTMEDNKTLESIVNSSGPIKFIASELIFENGPNRIDIVGYDSKDLYFFELKKDRTSKIKQLVDYVKYYKKNEVLGRLLSVYPITSVEKYDAIKPIMVMRYAENSSSNKRWTDLANKGKIQIIFYKPSYTFE